MTGLCLKLLQAYFDACFFAHLLSWQTWALHYRGILLSLKSAFELVKLQYFSLMPRKSTIGVDALIHAVTHVFPVPCGHWESTSATVCAVRLLSIYFPSLRRTKGEGWYQHRLRLSGRETDDCELITAAAMCQLVIGFVSCVYSCFKS